MKKNRIMQSVSKLELKNSLIESMEKNDMAFDYVQDKIRECENILNYNPDDLLTQKDYENLKYIEFVLKYIEDSYRKSAKTIGVVIWLIIVVWAVV